jgi:hypothetical protein
LGKLQVATLAGETIGEGQLIAKHAVELIHSSLQADRRGVGGND